MTANMLVQHIWERLERNSDEVADLYYRLLRLWWPQGYQNWLYRSGPRFLYKRTIHYPNSQWPLIGDREYKENLWELPTPCVCGGTGTCFFCQGYDCYVCKDGECVGSRDGTCRGGMCWACSGDGICTRCGGKAKGQEKDK